VSSEQRILRGLGVFGAFWQLLWLGADSGLRAFLVREPMHLASLLVLGSFVCWVALWPLLFGPWRNLERARGVQAAIVVLLAVSGIMLVASTQPVDDVGWFAGASVVNLAAGLAGLSFPRRWGSICVLLMVIAEAAFVVVVHASGAQETPLPKALIYPMYALALGLAAIASRHALVESARAQDVLAAELALQREELASSEYTDAAVSAAETRLHETVLNTLTAIVRGGFGRDDATQERLREHAREAADVLTMVSEGADSSATWAGDLGVDLAAPIVDLRAMGVDVTMEGVLKLERKRKFPSYPGSPDPALQPSADYVAMATAVREALLNVIRHADARNVGITGDISREGDRLLWRVVVRDDGRGFDGNTFGFGLRSVVFDGLAAASGQARVTSTPGSGTQVVLEVPLESSAPVRATPVVGVLGAIGGPVVAAFAAFTFYVAGVTWADAANPWANAAALIVFVIAGAAIALTIRTGRYRYAPWWLVLAVVVLVPLMAEIEERAGGAAGAAGDWSSEAGAALLFVVVAAGPLWAGLPALVSWFIAQDMKWIELTQPGTVVIVVAAILSWTLHRTDTASARRIVDIETQREALAASQVRLSGVRQRYAEVDAARLSRLLHDIADGVVDPAAASVRDECARQERMIRSVLLLHPDTNAVHRDLARLAAIARDRNIDLSIAAAPDVASGAGLETFAAARWLLQNADPGSSARASVSRNDGGCVFRLVAVVPVANRGRLPADAEVVDEDQGLVAIEESCGHFVDEGH